MPYYNTRNQDRISVTGWTPWGGRSTQPSTLSGTVLCNVSVLLLSTKCLLEHNKLQQLQNLRTFRHINRPTNTKTAKDSFYARQLYRQVLLRARISYGNSVCLSVHLSVTTRYRTKPRWDRDSGSSPYHSLGSLVSCEVIWCQRGRRFPSNEGIKEGYPP